MAYSASTVWLGWTNQQPSAQVAAAVAITNCNRPDARLLCSEACCWMAFALSRATGAIGFSARLDQRQAIDEAIAIASSTGAIDARLVVVFNTDTGEEFKPPQP